MTTVIPVDDYSPIFVGDTSNPFSIYVAHKNGFMSLIGSTITMKLFNAVTNTIKTCAGPWTIDSRDNGKASYVYQSNDVNAVGSWQIWITITIGGKPVHVDDGTGNPKILVINPLPVGV
jgi:hypothetical protein